MIFTVEKSYNVAGCSLNQETETELLLCPGGRKTLTQK